MTHDQLFKDLLRNGLDAFLDLFFPDLAAGMDFGDLQFLDKETFTDLPAGRRRESDLVARVRSREGEGRLVLFLLEIEDREGRTRDGETIDVRLFQYYSALWSRYRLPVVPIVLYLFQSSQGLARGVHRQGVLGYTFLELTYLTVGLPRLLAPEWLKKGGALAGALAALMNSGAWGRARLKSECLETIARSATNRAFQFLALNCVETYLRLSPEEHVIFEALLAQEAYMEAREIHKTWADELAEEAEGRGVEKGLKQGLEKGMEKGRQEVLLKLLQLKFGPLEAHSLELVRGVHDPAEIERLVERILTADSLADLGLE